ncbi:ATP-grasp fold amidoligase family protein [Cognatishimia sp. SS12]|uniref:ATP-grasp fold amidoligase family protein n=1 Tax=Cognatishimia sp. SS12 TaxID=2979465 RepID=UPI00232CB5D6|nr:ATP-grasp fold amidoligase family protein [Cognatishimia sp. SS12]MDC0739105.1 ATP-grasp fold amidoligase family protein [Cognatishimia sp. SS12]
MANALSKRARSANPDSSRLRGSARSALRLILSKGLFGTDRPAPAGTLRGLDVLPPSIIRQRLARASVISHSVYGAQIDFENPKGFFEKLVLSKFFAPIPMPSPADSLALTRFIPADLSEVIKPLPVVWQGAHALTSDRVGAEITPGQYFAKSNMLPDTALAITFPMDPAMTLRAKRLTRKWLDTDAGERTSEWWRNLIAPRAFLERDVRVENNPVSHWRFHIGGGHILGIVVVPDYRRSSAEALYDENFTPLPHELFLPNSAPITEPSYFKSLRYAALRIAEPFEYVRVDICHNGEQAYLSALNLTPFGAQRLPRSHALNAIMGEKWQSDLFRG